MLVFAIRILICAETCGLYNELALKFLKKFVTNYSTLYSSHFISYNVHSLINLPGYVLIHGPLDKFSCFRYENYLQDIKKSMISIKYPLQENFNRILQKQNNNVNLPSQLYRQHFVLSNEITHITFSPLYKINDQLFEKITLKLSTTTINVLKKKDRYNMFTNNTLVLVQHIVQPQNKPSYLIVKQFLNCSEFTHTPLSSSKIGVYIVDTAKMSEIHCVSVNDIKYKCFFY